MYNVHGVQYVPINMGNEKRIQDRLIVKNYSILIPDFKSRIIIMSARVYFMKTVNGCKDVMSLQDEQ